MAESVTARAVWLLPVVVGCLAIIVSLFVRGSSVVPPLVLNGLALGNFGCSLRPGSSVRAKLALRALALVLVLCWLILFVF